VIYSNAIQWQCRPGYPVQFSSAIVRHATQVTAKKMVRVLHDQKALSEVFVR